MMKVSKLGLSSDTSASTRSSMVGRLCSIPGRQKNTELRGSNLSPQERPACSLSLQRAWRPGPAGGSGSALGFNTNQAASEQQGARRTLQQTVWLLVPARAAPAYSNKQELAGRSRRFLSAAVVSRRSRIPGTFTDYSRMCSMEQT